VVGLFALKFHTQRARLVPLSGFVQTLTCGQAKVLCPEDHPRDIALALAPSQKPAIQGHFSDAQPAMIAGPVP
jgi:hypothetical protein